MDNQPAYEISYTEALMKPDFDTIGFCKLLKISEAQFVKAINDGKKNFKGKYIKILPITFMKNVSREEVARIQEIIFKYPAFSIVSRPQRRYEVNTSGNLLGYTNEVNEREIKKTPSIIFQATILGNLVWKKPTKKN